MTRLPTRQHYYGAKTRPVQRRETRGEVYEDEYTFGSVVMDFTPSDVLPDGTASDVHGDVAYYRYDETKPPVCITQDAVYRNKSSDRKLAQEQAYYVLSMLDAGGYVTGWMKK